ncbi:MAG TPA: protoporphyrinogen oxidase [Gaiellaceae bacterium]|nr:protoporphyrinogen oxidase [Gaiellaceae bacterium]
MRVVVVGGGIAGLAAARRLEHVAPDVSIALVESDELPGGKLRTEVVDGFVVEAAPDSFLSRKPRGVGLVEELGLADELVTRRAENHRTFVRRSGDLHPLPEGLTGMIPTSLDALERSDLLSAEGKARFAAEAEVPPSAGDEDESVAAFVTRRFGREAYDALVEPLMTGIYGGDGERMSLRATFPQLRALELEHGSLLRGLDSPAASDRPPFLSLRRGMGSLVAALVDGFECTELLLGRRVTSVRRGYQVELADGEVVEADGVVLATPAFVTAELLADLDPVLAAEHADIPYGSSAVVTLAFAAEDVEPLDGYGYLVPRTEASDVLACTWSSQKWEGRAPAGAVLVRVYAGRFGGRDVTQAGDDELVGLARAELRTDAEPMRTWVNRWPRGMPQYVLGHPGRLLRIEERLARHPGLAVAGAAYRGVGIPDCIASGEAAAESVVKALAGARA